MCELCLETCIIHELSTMDKNNDCDSVYYIGGLPKFIIVSFCTRDGLVIVSFLIVPLMNTYLSNLLTPKAKKEKKLHSIKNEDGISERLPFYR